MIDDARRSNSRSSKSQIKKTIDDDDDLKGKRDLIESIDGIGPITSATLLAETPHIEKFESSKAFAAFAGVCPQIQTIGSIGLKFSDDKNWQSRNPQSALHGRAGGASKQPSHQGVRRATPRARQATKMEIIVASMRKLLVLVFGVLKTGRPFDPNWA